MPPVVHIDLPPLAFADATDVRRRDLASHGQALWEFSADHVLGTRLRSLIVTSSHTVAQTAVKAMRAEIERLNGVFNDRRSDSELSRLNRIGYIDASTDLFTVVELSEKWRRITEGAFDGRMGSLLKLWSTVAEPTQHSIAQALGALQTASVKLLPAQRRIELSSETKLSLDGVAKGYIVDAALNAACRAAPALEGIGVDIGGDIRCWGRAPDPNGWRIGVAEMLRPADNARLVDAVVLQNGAVATSGRGPRDCVAKGYRSTTLSPLSGQPVDVIAASVVASHAADADAIATACMVLGPQRAIAMVDGLNHVAARITDAHEQVFVSRDWTRIALAAGAPTPSLTAQNRPTKSGVLGKSASATKTVEQTATNLSALPKNRLPPEQRWPADWEIGITYSEPQDKEKQGSDFRTPYIVVWITDMENRPISTLFMLGTAVKWHRDNFIWWGMQGERAPRIVDFRSQGTTMSGRYQMYWGGVDDDYKPVPLGKYLLHLETSQERGKHTHRAVPIEVGRDRFKVSLPNIVESGGIDITYGHYNDRFKAEY